MTRASPKVCFAALATAALFSAGVFAADMSAPSALKNRTIGYVWTEGRWAAYQTPDGKQECPDGLNLMGPSERFHADFPNGGSVTDTSLKREGETEFPDDYTDNVPFKLVKGKIATGLNLDGKIGANDFVGPNGEEGIDNQLYRVIGCLDLFRESTALMWYFSTRYMRESNYSRVLLELTGVDSLTNDPEVDVHIYRGLDPLTMDASNDKATPGGTQRIDKRFGKKYMQVLKGHIVDGVLTTEPSDIRMPWVNFPETPSRLFLRGGRFQLKLDAERATGMLGGYADIESWYYQLTSSWATQFMSQGRTNAPSVYREVRRLADAHPDKDGRMTAISSAVEVGFTQVYIEHAP